jgi:hypothetical protein
MHLTDGYGSTEAGPVFANGPVEAREIAAREAF